MGIQPHVPYRYAEYADETDSEDHGNEGKLHHEFSIAFSLVLFYIYKGRIMKEKQKGEIDDPDWR
jgi:hypothetical protein